MQDKYLNGDTINLLGISLGILKLPPFLIAEKLGTSNFAQALFSGKHASAAEKFRYLSIVTLKNFDLYTLDMNTLVKILQDISFKLV
jgi:hypothetical protein